MNIRTKHEWRRVFGLSATFLLAFSVFLACKKKETTLGINDIDQNSLLEGGGIDTFSLVTFSEDDDTVITKNPALAVLGSYNDPVFGTFNASIFTQIRLATLNPNFGDTTTLIIDSMVLSLRYAGFNGKKDVQTFEVHELDEIIDKDTAVKYYIDSDLAIKVDNLIMPGTGSITPKPDSKVVIDGVEGDAQLRLSLDTNLARKLIRETYTPGGAFSSADNFTNFFKGVRISVNNPPQAYGSGGVFYFNLVDAASKMTIYYRQTEIVGGVPTELKKKYDFVINSSSEDFTKVVKVRTGTNVKNVLDNPSMGQTEFYSQAFGTRAVVGMKGLENLPKNIIIHKAELFLPVQFQTGSPYFPGSQITVAARLDSTTEDFFLLNVGSFSDFRKGYVIDLRNYVQQIVAGKVKNKDLYLAPRQFITSAERIIFNGSNTSNKAQPKLSIIYTEF
jgi:uncharacterized protein YbcV (DUF1398 family)